MALNAAWVRRSEARLALAYGWGRLRRPLAPEPGDPTLVARAQRWQQQALRDSADRFLGCAHRILLCTPPSWAAAVWFQDLEAALRHMGVACHRVPPAQPLSPEVVWSFRPTTLIALDQEDVLAQLPLEEIQSYRRRHGCLRLLIPTRSDLLGGGPLTPADARRLAWAQAGKTADAFVSLYAPELYQSHWRDWAGAGFPYLSLPQGANPLEDAAQVQVRTQAWFFCSANNPARLRSAVVSLGPLLARYRGEWAGSGWSFGGPAIPAAQMPDHYARARVVLAPLVGFLCQHPAEITHRVFEAAACGAFQVTLQTPITHRFFPPDALVAAPSAEAFAAVVEAWMHRPEARARLAARALDHVYAHHTTFHRVEQLLAWLDAQG